MELNIEKSNFTKYSLEKISKALQVGLSNNYKVVEVSIVDCPNLRNWGCPSEGISGNQKIIDVGGEPYMHDPNFIGAEFDYEEISKIIGSQKSYALGAGSGEWLWFRRMPLVQANTLSLALFQANTLSLASFQVNTLSLTLARPQRGRGRGGAAGAGSAPFRRVRGPAQRGTPTTPL